MKSWTLISMAWLLVAGTPAAAFADAQAGEPVRAAEAADVEVAAGSETAAVTAPETTPVADAQVAQPESDPLADAVRELSSTEPAQVEPARLDPARPIPAGGSFAFGPLGVDSQGRTGRIHFVVRGDTLWDISDAYLGTPWVWPSVWDENHDIANPHLIVPGDRIWISSTEMRRITESEAAEMMAAAEAQDDSALADVDDEIPSEDELIEGVPAALDETPMAVPMAVPVTGPAPEKQEITVEWMESMGFLTTEQIEAATSIVGSPSIRNWLGQGDPVYLGLGDGEVKVGDQFWVFQEVKSVHALRSERLIGYHVEHLGWIEVTEVSAESAMGEIKESWVEIERGARVVPRGKPTVTFEVVPADKDIEGYVVYTPNSRTVMGTIDHVYLDIGADEGLRVGSKLDVVDPAYEAWDSANRHSVEIPDYSYAQLVVLSTQPHSAVALVTHTRREIEVGQVVRGSGK